MNKKTVPPAQALIYIIEGAIDFLEWLKILELEWNVSFKEKNRKAPDIRKKQRIVLDAFCIYIGSIFDKRSGSHSLLNSYQKDTFIDYVYKEKIVQKCINHRNNRSGHQSKNYGFIVSLNEVIESNLLNLLKDIYFIVATSRLNES